MPRTLERGGDVCLRPEHAGELGVEEAVRRVQLDRAPDGVFGHVGEEVEREHVSREGEAGQVEQHDSREPITAQEHLAGLARENGPLTQERHLGAHATAVEGEDG